jgi:hypothetical protein
MLPCSRTDDFESEVEKSNKILKVKTLNDDYQPEIQILTNRKAINAAIRRLNLRDLLSEAIEQIHLVAPQEANGARATAAIDTNGMQTLLVGSVSRNGLFADIGILADADCTDLKVNNALVEIFEDCARVLSQRMPGSCICEHCLAKQGDQF